MTKRLKARSVLPLVVNLFKLATGAGLFLLLALYAVNGFKFVDSTELQSDEQQISYHYEFFVDQENQYNVTQVSTDPTLFSPAEKDGFPFKYGSQAYWIKVPINNHSSKTKNLVMHADNPMLDAIDFHLLRSDGSVHTLLLGDTRPAQGHHEKGSFSFPTSAFTLAPKEQATMYVRSQTRGIPKVPLALYEQEKFDFRIQITQLIFGAFIGVVLVSAVFNLVLYSAIKDILFLCYIGYLSCSLLTLSAVNGYGIFLLPVRAQLWVSNHIFFFNFLIVAFLSFFTLFFLSYHRPKTNVFKYGTKFGFCFGFIALSSFFFSEATQAKVFFSLVPIIYLFFTYLLVPKIKTDLHWARFYFLSWVPLIIGSVLQSLILLGYLQNSFFIRHAFLISVFLEMALMAFAVAERMRRYEQERLYSMRYHKDTDMPRKMTIEYRLTKLIKEDRKLSVLVIQPEQIDRVTIYVSEAMRTAFFTHINKTLQAFITENMGIVKLTTRGDKLCFLENNMIALIIDHSVSRMPIPNIIAEIQHKITEVYEINGLKLPLSAIVGVTKYPEHGETPAVLLHRAQQVIRVAESSQQKWAYYEAETSEKASYLLQIAASLDLALENAEFEIYHQPQINLKNSAIHGSECLIRWNHPTQGFIPPNVFIPAAEDMGLIYRLTLWVIRTALKQQEYILQHTDQEQMISINISGKDITSENFYQNIVNIINEFTVPPRLIIFELTESATITNNQQALQTIKKFNELGITISLDDFGTGYSSLSYVSKLPFQELKIDRQFVENVNDDRRLYTIAEATVRMAKGLKFQVVAEGINSTLDEGTLRNFGCDIGQGYYYAKPMPLDKYLAWVKERDIKTEDSQPCQRWGTVIDG